MPEETARQAYERKYGRDDGEGPPDTGGLPDASEGRLNPVTESPLYRQFLWDHIRFARAHAKEIPLKPRRRLKPEEEADLRWNLEMMVHQARYALAYLKARDDAEEAVAEAGEHGPHALSGNCWHKRAAYECGTCGVGEMCDVCHRHDEPRGDCSGCARCAPCDAEADG